MTKNHRYSYFFQLFPKIFTLFEYKYLYVKVKMDHLFSVLLTALHKGQLHFQDPNIGSGKVSPWTTIYLRRKEEFKKKFIAFSSPEFHICIKRRVVSLDRNYENRRCQDSTYNDTHIHMPSLFGLFLDCFIY